jgi:hypothetical protein
MSLRYALVHVITEGPSDAQFLKNTVAPYLQSVGVMLVAKPMETSHGHAGGGVNLDRLKRHAHNTLAREKNAYLGTFFDLYALSTSITSLVNMSAMSNPLDAAALIESHLAMALQAHTDCRIARLLPHVQPYELEGLFFSDTTSLCAVLPSWQSAQADLQKVRISESSPEHINSGFDSKPSKRLADLLRPRYHKTVHAPLIGQQIGLAKIMQECKHFASWIDRLAQLKPLV